jgi:hypothetical protein
MKLFTITKTGYTAGIHGNTGEYFTLIIVNETGLQSFKFGGMYGAESRVAEVMKEKGYKDYYTTSNYGKLTRKDIAQGNTYSEHSMINYLKNEAQV